MARIRTIKPDITESETLAGLPIPVCWTFACLWPHCDDHGRRKAQPRLVRSDLYPMRDDMSVDDVAEHLTLLAENDLICLYTGCDGKPYLHVVNWKEHQKVDRPSKSRIPPCREHEADAECARHEGGCESSSLDLDESSRVSREVLASVRETPATGPRTVDLGPRTVPTTSAAQLAARTDDEVARAQEITRRYHEAEPMCRFPAVMQIVRKAIQAQRWTDDQITDALLRLAKEGRPVTVDVLRVELDGLPPPRAQSQNTRNLSAAMERARRAEEAGA